VTLKIQLAGTTVQREICECRKRYLGMFAGRRVGKTFTIRNRIVSRCMTQPGFRYWYVAPTYAQCREQYQGMVDHPALVEYIEKFRLQPYPRVDFKNGSYVAYRSFERAANLRGSGLDEVGVDEIQDIDETDFWAVVRPLISDRRGTLMVAGQFRGFNWYYDQFYVPGQNPNSRTHKSWRIPSSEGLVFLSKEGQEELEFAKATLPRAIYDQEYACIPSANQAAVFREEDLTACTGGKRYRKSAPNRKNVIGLDLGRIADPSAIVVLNAEVGRVLYSELRPLRERHEVTAKYVARLQRDFGGAPVVVDVTGGATGGHAPQDAYVKFYRREIKNLREFVWNRGNKERIIQHLAVAIEQHNLQIPKSEAELHDQLRLYEFEYRGGRYDYHGPRGHSDDMVAALAMAWYAKVRNWGTRMGGSSLGALL